MFSLMLTWCLVANTHDCRVQTLHVDKMWECMSGAQQVASEQQRQNLWLVDRRLAGWKCQVGNRQEGGA